MKDILIDPALKPGNLILIQKKPISVYEAAFCYLTGIWQSSNLVSNSRSNCSPSRVWGRNSE